MTTERGTIILILYGATLSTTRKHKYVHCTHSPTNSHTYAHPLALPQKHIEEYLACLDVTTKLKVRVSDKAVANTSVGKK